MKKLLGLGLILASTSSFAYSWQITNADSYYAKTEKEIVKLLTQFPEVLENSTYQAKEMDFVSVTDYTQEYTGETTCEEGDERLTVDMLTYFACPINKPTECITRFREILSDVDPCL